MIGLAHITQVLVPNELFEHSHETLRTIGEAGVEGLVLWAGVAENDRFMVQAVLRPAQHCSSGEHGLLVLVDGRELHRIGVWLYERHMQFIAQVHSHPTDAYHSSTDDTIPIVTTEGGLSLVVPDFALGAACLADYAVFRLGATGAWSELTTAAASSLIQLVDEPFDLQ